MKKMAFVLSVLLILAVSCKDDKNIAVKEQWSTPPKLMVPESVFYDSLKNILYVSNINGKPAEKNGKGFISRIDLDGTIKDLKWITGLNAPKGMGMKGSKLFVADIDCLVEIDTDEEKITKSYPADGAHFLNDIAVDDDGVVYVSDMNTNRIYTLRQGSFALWLELTDYDSVNGLLMHGKNLLAGTAQGVLRIITGAADVSLFIRHSRGIDGLKHLGDEHFIVTDWQGRTSLIAPRKKSILVLDTTDKKINAADIEYIAHEKLLLIPTFFDNRVVAYKIE